MKGEDDLGHYWIDESGCYNINELGNMIYYFNYERFGQYIALKQGGIFASCGYIYHTGESFSSNYDGKSVPEEFYVLIKLSDLDIPHKALNELYGASLLMILFFVVTLAKMLFDIFLLTLCIQTVFFLLIGII